MRKPRAWLVFGEIGCWFDEPGKLTDYILPRAEEACGKTVPSSILAAVSFFKKVGGVADKNRVKAVLMVRSAVNQVTQDMEKGSSALVAA